MQISKLMKGNTKLVQSFMTQKLALRTFAEITPECQAHLKKLGITNKNIVFNPT